MCTYIFYIKYIRDVPIRGAPGPPKKNPLFETKSKRKTMEIYYKLYRFLWSIDISIDKVEKTLRLLWKDKIVYEKIYTSSIEMCTVE